MAGNTEGVEIIMVDRNILDNNQQQVLYISKYHHRKMMLNVQESSGLCLEGG